MNIKSVAVFGGSGKIGRHVVPWLVEHGYAVRALVHRSPVAGEGVVSV
ncbi:MAG: NmrA family NAD(P)-binding protein, partial [Armatimonadia bacterium]